MREVDFLAFDDRAFRGQLITSWENHQVVWADNRRGEKNIFVVFAGHALTHSTPETLMDDRWIPAKPYRKIMRFLAERGQSIDWMSYK